MPLRKKLGLFPWVGLWLKYHSFILGSSLEEDWYVCILVHNQRISRFKYITTNPVVILLNTFSFRGKWILKERIYTSRAFPWGVVILVQRTRSFFVLAMISKRSLPHRGPCPPARRPVHKKPGPLYNRWVAKWGLYLALGTSLMLTFSVD